MTKKQISVQFHVSRRDTVRPVTVNTDVEDFSSVKLTLIDVLVLYYSVKFHSTQTLAERSQNTWHGCNLDLSLHMNVHSNKDKCTECRKFFGSKPA